MSHLVKLLFALSLLFPYFAYSNTQGADSLLKVTWQYAICADVVIGGFETQEQSQAAYMKFLMAMKKNVGRIVEIDEGNRREDPNIQIKALGKEAYIGYFIGLLSAGPDGFQEKKKALVKTYNFDWKRAHIQLWNENGCDAIYNGLPK